MLQLEMQHRCTLASFDQSAGWMLEAEFALADDKGDKAQIENWGTTCSFLIL